MKLLIENFRKYLKEQEESVEQKVDELYKHSVEHHTKHNVLLQVLGDNEGNVEAAASKTIENIKYSLEQDIDNQMGDGWSEHNHEWDEEKALQVLKDKELYVKDGESSKEKGETLQDVIQGLISDARSENENI